MSQMLVTAYVPIYLAIIFHVINAMKDTLSSSLLQN